MNTNELQQKIEEVVKLLRAYSFEIQEIESKRSSLEASELVNSERERKVVLREIEIQKKETDLISQQKYIEELDKNNAIILSKIKKEKESLTLLVSQRRSFEQERLQLEIEKKSVEQLKRELDHLRYDKEQFEQEKKLFNKEKEAIKEEHKLLALRQQNIILHEERNDKIERMTQL